MRDLNLEAKLVWQRGVFGSGRLTDRGRERETFDEPIGLDNPFLALDNVIVAPHLASYTKEAHDQLDLNAFKKVKSILRGDTLWDVKNSELFD